MTTSPGSRRRISPGVVFLAIALIGSIAYVAFAITVRDASQIPLLASGAVVLAIVFGALAVYCLRATWRGGQPGPGRPRRAGRARRWHRRDRRGRSPRGALILFQIASGPS